MAAYLADGRRFLLLGVVRDLTPFLLLTVLVLFGVIAFETSLAPLIACIARALAEPLR